MKHEDPPRLKVGEKFIVPGSADPGEQEDTFIVRRVTECAAYVEKVLRTPRRVQINDENGDEIRSFFAMSGGGVIPISPFSLVRRIQ